MLARLAIAIAVLSVFGGCAGRAAVARPTEPATCAAVAEGGEGDAAQRNFDEGQCLYERGEFGASAIAFRRALAVSHMPAIFANVARSYQQAGDCAQAIRYYRLYVDGNPDASDRESVLGTIGVLTSSCDALTDRPMLASP